MKNGFIRFALLCPNIRVGDATNNLKAIKTDIKKAVSFGAEVCVLPCDILLGTSAGSLQAHSEFERVELASLNSLAEFTSTLPCSVILSTSNDNDTQTSLLLANGEIFDHFDDGNSYFSINCGGQKFSISSAFSDADTDCIISTAPAALTVDSLKQKELFFKNRSVSRTCASIYVGTSAFEAINGGLYSNARIVFELGEKLLSTESDLDNIDIVDIDIEVIQAAKVKRGTSSVFDPESTCKIKGNQKETPRVFSSKPFVPDANEFPRIFDILHRSIYSRFSYANTNKIVLGLSGGLDSTFSLLLAVDAFTKYKINTKNILAVSMPTINSSKRTRQNARALASILGVEFLEIDINTSVLEHLKTINHESATDIVYENAQARRRTHILLDLANKHNALMLGTSDLSEIALGWSTFGGDQVAHFNPNSGTPKTLIRALIRHYLLTCDDEALAELLNDILRTPISPELLKNQDTEKINGPYEFHDFFLYHLIGRGQSVEKVLFLAKKAFKDAKMSDIMGYLRTFITRFFKYQFKRRASCDGVPLFNFDHSLLDIPTELSGVAFLAVLDKLAKQK